MRSKTFIVGAIIIGFWVLCAIFGSLLVQDPYASNPLNDLASPSADHWFGTDRLGRDVFARVIVGSRGILITAPLATLLATVLGTALGLVTGYFRGAVDDVISRIIDAFLALPVVILALLALTSVGASKLTIICVVGFAFAPIIARTVRAAVLGEREMEYVAAARLRNERTSYVMFVEILPNVTGPVMVEATVRLGYAVFTIATLSFLGLRHPAARSRLGAAGGRALRPDQRRLLVDRAVPGAGHHVPGGRRQPGGGRRGAVLRAMSAPAPAKAVPALALRDLKVEYRVRGELEGRPARRHVLGRRRRVLRAGRGVRLRQVDGRVRRRELPAAQRPHLRRRRRGRRRGHRRACPRPTCAGCAPSACRWSTRTPARR